MPFIGKNPTAGFASIVKDDFTGNGSTTVFTLSKQVVTANDIAVFVGNVRQEPTDAYTVSGTTLTMSAAPATGINFYVLHIAGTIESSVIPPDGSIGTAKLVNGAVTSAKLDTNIAVTGTLTANGGAVFNEDSNNVNFRVESNNDANMFVVDGTSDTVKIGSNAGNYAKLSIRNEAAGAQERGLYVELAPASGTTPNNLAVFSAANGNITTPLVRIHHESPAANQIMLQATTTGSNTVKFSVDEDGDIYTAGGINLGGTGSANYLDDYETGDFSPAFESTGATFSHATRAGNYVVIGQFCFFTFRVGISSISGTQTNTVRLTLPFTTDALNGTYHGGSFGHYYNVDLSTTGILAYQTSSSSSTVELKVIGDNIGETAVLASHLKTGTEIRGHIMYKIA
jgi:hypothetical protein